MRKALMILTGMFVVIGLSPLALAGEHGGKEHGGTTAVQQVTKEPSKDDIRNAMKAFVEAQTQKTGGNFEVIDPDTNKKRRLQMIRVHERVGKTGDYYYSCADFKDVDTGEMLDLDLDVADKNGQLQVADVRLHKVEGEPRFTYDENDNRIPLTDTESHMESALPGLHEHKGSTKGSYKGSATQEHGGKEHGGK
ncbi:MAG: hypothetical protein KC618_02930 [Candidatus Omnitrophica bacterium]|nr:hypothetical protein [Candidatus Omnitrophota bacterium]